MLKGTTRAPGIHAAAYVFTAAAFLALQTAAVALADCQPSDAASDAGTAHYWDYEVFHKYRGTLVSGHQLVGVIGISERFLCRAGGTGCTEIEAEPAANAPLRAWGYYYDDVDGMLGLVGGSVEKRRWSLRVTYPSGKQSEVFNLFEGDSGVLLGSWPQSMEGSKPFHVELRASKTEVVNFCADDWRATQPHLAGGEKKAWLEMKQRLRASLAPASPLLPENGAYVGKSFTEAGKCVRYRDGGESRAETKRRTFCTCELENWEEENVAVWESGGPRPNMSRNRSTWLIERGRKNRIAVHDLFTPNGLELIKERCEAQGLRFTQYDGEMHWYEFINSVNDSGYTTMFDILGLEITGYTSGRMTGKAFVPYSHLRKHLTKKGKEVLGRLIE